MNQLTVAFKTVGCRLNQAETAQMRAAFEAAGYRAVPFGAPCAVCVIHGCAVTASAEQDSLRLARSVKRRQPQACVALVGCVAETGGTDLHSRCGADLIVGQHEKFRLVELLAGRGFPAAPRNAEGLPPRFDTTRAIVKAQDGCEFRCAYCVVPNARGPARSRPCAEVVDEVAALAGSGFKEIVLTGANLGCYHDCGRKLTDLLERVAAIPAVLRIRLSSIELSTVERAVIDFMAASPKVCRFLHLPLQSGADRVLRAMGRRYTARQFRAAAQYAAAKVAMLGLGTDVLVGFPGETPAEFAATEDLVRELPFSNLHVFAYSRRQGTPADTLPNQVPESEKKARVARLIALGNQKRAEFAQQWLGRRASVLVESVNSSGTGAGWTGEYLPARIQGPHLSVNQVAEFVVQKADGATLLGSMPDPLKFLLDHCTC